MNTYGLVTALPTIGSATSSSAAGVRSGLINSACLVVADGRTWFAASDYNEDTRAALQHVGLDAQVAGYCP